MRKWLTDKRIILNLTQDEVAKRSKIARTTYAMIEQDERNPSVQVAKSIAVVLDFNWIIFFDYKLHISRIVGVTVSKTSKKLNV